MFAPDEKLLAKLKEIVKDYVEHGQGPTPPDAIVSALGALGFELRKDHEYRERRVFYHGPKGLVFKLSYVLTRWTPVRAIPTVEVHRSGRNMVWLLQPLAEYLITGDERLMRRYEQLRCELRYRVFGEDCHVGNVGFYQGKLVAIDW